MFGKVYSSCAAFFKGTTKAFQRQIVKKLTLRHHQVFKPEYLSNNFELPKQLDNYIIKKGDPPKGIYFIISGEVIVGNSTNEFEYFRLKKGEYFGDSSLMAGTLSSYNYYYEVGGAV